MVDNHNERNLKGHISAVGTSALAIGLGLAASTDARATIVPVIEYGSAGPLTDISIGGADALGFSTTTINCRTDPYGNTTCDTGLFAEGPTGGVVGTYGGVDRLSSGYSIGLGSALPSSGLMASTSTGAPGEWFDQSGFLGFSFTLSDGLHFGWADITVNDQLGGTLNALYYEACANESISAGTTSGGASCTPISKPAGAVPAPGSLALLAAGALPLLRYRRRRSAQSTRC